MNSLLFPKYATVLLLAMLCTPSAHAQTPGDGSDVELTESDIIIFCAGHEGNLIEEAREHGKELFGSFVTFFENYHRIQCPPAFPSPLYLSVSKSPFSIQVDKEIEFISRLSPEKRHLILNRPSKGFFKQTVLDVVYRALKANQDDGNEEAVIRYKKLKKNLESAGAKRLAELTEEEKAAFN